MCGSGCARIRRSERGRRAFARYPIVDLASSFLVEGLPIRGDFANDVLVQVRDVWECPEGMGRPEEVAQGLAWILFLAD